MMIWLRIADGIEKASVNGWNITRVLCRRRGREMWHYTAVNDKETVSGSFDLIKRVTSKAEQLKLDI